MNLIISKNMSKGFSLIEFLIAMLIGLFLLSGIASSYISSHKSSVKQDELSKLEDNGRLALEILSKTIVHTGYTPIHAGILNPPFIYNGGPPVVSETCPDGSDSVVKTGIFSATRYTRDFVNGDQIGVIYNSDSRVFTDCSGGELPVSCQVEAPSVAAVGAPSDKSKIYNVFYLQKKKNRLMCVGSRTKAPQVIADGIENIQFMYGLSATGGDVDRYVRATDIVDAAMWASVVSVQIAVLVRSDKPVKSKKEKITYTLLDQEYKTKSDKYQRAVFTTTVRLRNTL